MSSVEDYIAAMDARLLASSGAPAASGSTAGFPAHPTQASYDPALAGGPILTIVSGSQAVMGEEEGGGRLKRARTSIDQGAGGGMDASIAQGGGDVSMDGLVEAGDEGDEGSGGQKKTKKQTSEKRKAQNRIAQRNFRERKERQAKQNEIDLVERNADVEKLKKLVEALHNENSFLRQNVQNPSVLARLPPTPNIVEYLAHLGPRSPSVPSHKSPRSTRGNGRLSVGSPEQELAANALSTLAASAGPPLPVDVGQASPGSASEGSGGGGGGGSYDPAVAAANAFRHLANPAMESLGAAQAATFANDILVSSNSDLSFPPPMTTDDLATTEAALPADFAAFWDLCFPSSYQNVGHPPEITPDTASTTVGTGTGSGSSGQSPRTPGPLHLAPTNQKRDPAPPSGHEGDDHSEAKKRAKQSKTTHREDAKQLEAAALHDAERIEHETSQSGQASRAKGKDAVVDPTLTEPPPALPEGENIRTLLRGTQAWGKLLTHPLINELDLDELARAMQKRARLYNGKPILTQADLISIWDSIPRRVEGRRQGFRLGDDGRDEVALGD